MSHPIVLSPTPASVAPARRWTEAALVSLGAGAQAFGVDPVPTGGKRAWFELAVP